MTSPIQKIAATDTNVQASTTNSTCIQSWMIDNLCHSHNWREISCISMEMVVVSINPVKPKNNFAQFSYQKVDWSGFSGQLQKKEKKLSKENTSFESLHTSGQKLCKHSSKFHSNLQLVYSRFAIWLAHGSSSVERFFLLGRWGQSGHKGPSVSCGWENVICYLQLHFWCHQPWLVWQLCWSILLQLESWLSDQISATY